MVRPLLIVPLFAALLLHPLRAQNPPSTIELTGTVRDLNTHRPVSLVNIFISGSRQGTTSDRRGHFFLRVSATSGKTRVIFRHVAYEELSLSAVSLAQTPVIYLQPRIIPLQTVEIQGEGSKRRSLLDLPQPTTILSAQQFDLRGYVDAGDLLRTEHSVQVDEDLSGRKTLTIRGGNPDEVIVVYNGVKLNNAFDNIFDFSLIELGDLDRIELIKGSNTVLFGAEAFSGVVNIVPGMEQDYTLRFQQRLGTYRSGNWGVNLYRKLRRLTTSYSYKRGAFERIIPAGQAGRGELLNSSEHHTANLVYHFSDENKLSAMWLRSGTDYDRSGEVLSRRLYTNTVFSGRYQGRLGRLGALDLSLAQKNLQDEQFYSLQHQTVDSLSRFIDDRTLTFSAEKQFSSEVLEAVLGYQFERAQVDLAASRRHMLERRHQGALAIVKIRGEAGTEFFDRTEINVSVRYDHMRDFERDPQRNTGFFSREGENNWRAVTTKFAFVLTGHRNDFVLESYLGFGSNTKFPTLLQQLSIPIVRQNEACYRANLNPEENKSMELSLTLTGEVQAQPVIKGWKITANLFQNLYKNKFRSATVPGGQIPFYDNVATAKIAGLETDGTLYLYNKKVRIATGIARYAISEKSAFPFKADFKQTLSLGVDHRGYSFEFLWIRESEQVAWLPDLNGELYAVTLDPYSNIDVHVSKRFELRKLGASFNFSGRNLLNDDTLLQGIAIRDRRFYFTFAFEY